MKVIAGVLLAVVIVVVVNAVLQRNDLAQTKAKMSVVQGGRA